LFRPKDRSDPTRQVSLPQVGNSTFADLMDIIAAIMQSPRRFALVVMGGLMLASLPLSLSRGGMLGTGVALALVGLLVVRERGKSAILRSPVVLIAVIAIGFVSWFGWGPIESQFRNAWAGRVNDTRGPLWAAGLRLVPSFLITGSGAGTFARIEPLARESSGGLNEADVENDHAHNEFLDAILEGGLLRLGITLLLVYAVCIAAWKAAQRLSGRPGGPVAFGLLFGFVSLAVHSITDFGIHIPAVAVIATVATAHALAASTDSGYLKVKRRYRLNADGTQTAVPSRLDANLPEPPPPRLVRFTGRSAMVLPGLFVLFSMVLVASGYSRTEAYSYFLAARTVKRIDHFQKAERLLPLQEGHVRAAPTDPVALADLATTHFDLALQESRSVHGMLIGGVAGAGVMDVLPPGVIQKRVVPGVRLSRAARDAGPLYATPHMRLGQYGPFVAKQEPPETYFERVKQLRPLDPEAWYATGLTALRRGDTTKAKQDWAQAMRLSPQILPAVFRAAGERVPLLDVIPENVAAVVAAANALYPDRVRDAGPRRELLLKATRVQARTLSVPDLIALASVHDELNDLTAAHDTWKLAIQRDPDTRDT
ncbi:MAG: O-antigen ligase family protein, partial [Gemmataceae bacterium]